MYTITINKRWWIQGSCVLIACILYLVASALSMAAIPKYINFQGKLTDSESNPVADGTYTVTFRLYNTETGASALWTEEQAVTVSSGIFNAVLGTKTAFELEFNTPYWLSVQIGSDNEMVPRQRLTSAGYAINADNLDTYTSTQFIRSDANDIVTGQLSFTYPGTSIILQPSSAPADDTKMLDLRNDSDTSKFSIDAEGDIVSQNVNVAGALEVSGETTLSGETTITDSLTIGADGVGHDIKLYSDDSNKYLLWDASESKLTVTGETEFTGTTTYQSLTISNNAMDMDGNIISNIGNTGTDFTNTGGLNIADDLIVTGTVEAEHLTSSDDATVTDQLNVGGSLDVDGTVQIDNTLTVGTDGTGYDTKLYGDLPGSYLAWDATSNKLLIVGKVAIGDRVPTHAVGSNDLYIEGDLEVDGSSWLGDAAGDNLVLQGTLSATNLEFTGDLIPGADDSYSLGSASNEWQNVYVDNIAYLDEARLNDNEKIKLGTGQDAEIYVGTEDNLYLANLTEDKDVYFQVNDGGTSKTPLFIDASTSRLGIGTTTPEETIDVSGGIRLSGRIRQGSLGDLAEMMKLSKLITNPENIELENPEILAAAKEKNLPIFLKNETEYIEYLAQRPEAADVVIITEDGGVMRSFKPFATNAIGVISTNPAQILRDGLENAVAVALNGIVPCKVTTENGLIKPGDLLASSSTPGHAMRAGENPPAGTVIGKALTSLEEEAGVVEIMVMMQ